MQFRIWGAMGIAAIGWGTSGVATRVALDTGIEPLTLVAWRVIIAAGITALYLVVTRGAMPTGRENWTTSSVLAVTNLALPSVLFTYAYSNAGAGFVGLIAALIPLGTAVIANFVLPGEKLYGIKVFGLGLGLFGIAVLLLMGDTGLGDEGNPLLAGSLGLISVMSISFAGVYAKGKSASYSPVQLTLAQFVVAAALLVVVAVIAEGVQRDITLWGWTMLTYMAVMGTVVPFVLFYWILRHASATKASLIGYIMPLIALAAGMVLLDESLEPGIAIGGALILAGVIITDRVERGEEVRTRAAP